MRFWTMRPLAACIPLLLIVAGCSAPVDKSAIGSRREVAASKDRLAAIYARQDRVIDRVAFFKPAEQAAASLEFTLAPLILRELEPAAGLQHQSEAQPPPTVYWLPDTLEVGGRTLPRIVYTWQLPGAAEKQGLRVTLNASGQPVIWEVLNDVSGLRLVFVSKSLEAAALKEFGAVLPGRRFAVEHRRDEAPSVVVARVLDDGPVPMGPIVCLGPDAHAVTTVICRCMPAQAKEVVATTVYNLLPGTRQQAAWPDPMLRLPRAAEW